MGLRRWCSIESKAFELAVEGNSSGVRILASCRGSVCSVFLGKANSQSLLATIEELIQERGLKVFWRRSKASFPTILHQDAQTSTGGSWLWRSTVQIDRGDIF